MTITAYEVMEYVKYYAKAGASQVYVRNSDLVLLSAKQVHELLTEIGRNCQVVPDDNNEKVEDAIGRLGIKRKDFIGSLPTENVGKWAKTI